MKKYIVSVFLLGVIIGTGIYLTNGTPEKPVVSSGMKYIADFSDDRNVLGFASNVFSAKIIRVIEEHDGPQGGPPVTFFEAEIIYNVKGNLSGNVILKQFIGYKETSTGKKISKFEEDTELLKPGLTYLLATKYDEQYDYYGIGSHPNEMKLISSDSNLDFNALRELSEKDEKTLKWQEAYKNEILPEHNNDARNSY